MCFQNPPSPPSSFLPKHLESEDGTSGLRNSAGHATRSEKAVGVRGGGRGQGALGRIVDATAKINIVESDSAKSVELDTFQRQWLHFAAQHLPGRIGVTAGDSDRAALENSALEKDLSANARVDTGQLDAVFISLC